MKNFIITIFCISLLSLTSCQDNKTAKKIVQKTKYKTTKFYTYDHSSSNVIWTAYKTTDKIAVKGTFRNIKVSGLQENINPKKVIEGLKFEVGINSIFSNDPTNIRDPKIIKYFFGLMKNPTLITTEIKEVDADNDTCIITITMNGISKNVTFDYNLSNGFLSIKGNLKLANWGLLKSLKSLNTQCEDVHKGADGKSVLWDEVDVQFDTKIKTVN